MNRTFGEIKDYPEIWVENNEESDVWIEVCLIAEEPGEALSVFLPEDSYSQLNASSHLVTRIL